MPKSKRHSSRKTPTKKDAEKSVVPHCSGGMGWFSGSVSPVHKPSPLKDIKIDPNPPDSYPKFCAWFVQILGYVQPIVESGQSYDDDGEFEYAADVQPHVEQIKAALTNAAYRIKHFPALMAKCDMMYRSGSLSAFVRKLRHDIDRGSFDRLLLERISDVIEGEAGDSTLPAERASVAEPAEDPQGSGGSIVEDAATPAGQSSGNAAEHPNDLIYLAVVKSEYKISQSTLDRDIDSGKLKVWRDKRGTKRMVSKAACDLIYIAQ